MSSYYVIFYKMNVIFCPSLSLWLFVWTSTIQWAMLCVITTDYSWYFHNKQAWCQKITLETPYLWTIGKFTSRSETCELTSCVKFHESFGPVTKRFFNGYMTKSEVQMTDSWKNVTEEVTYKFLDISHMLLQSQYLGTIHTLLRWNNVY